MSRLTNEWRILNSRRVYARVARHAPNDAPAVVLVHGLGVSGTYLVPIAERLADRYATFVPDLPGWGNSEPPPRALGIPELADALAAWMRAGGPAHATFVAHSLGCQIVIDLALRYPHLIERAVLIGPTLDPETQSIWRLASRGLRDLLHEPWSLWPILFHDYCVMGPLRFTQTLRYAIADPLLDKLPHVRVPTLVVRGGWDPIASECWVERMANCLPNGRPLCLSGTAHSVHFAAPDAVAQTIDRFVGTRRSRTIEQVV